MTAGTTGRGWETTRTGAGAGRSCLCCGIAIGSPGFFANIDCRAEKGTTGDGAYRATTGRLTTVAGGCGALLKNDVVCPRALTGCGATRGAGMTALIDRI